MKMRMEYTCPLELVHDMIKGKWKPIILWRLRLGGDIPGEAGAWHRRHYTEDAAGAVKGTDGLRICGKEILWGIPAPGGIFLNGWYGNENIGGVKDHPAYRDWLSESKRHGTYSGGEGRSPGLVPTKKRVIYCPGTAAYNIIIKSDWRLSKMNVTTVDFLDLSVHPADAYHF